MKALFVLILALTGRLSAVQLATGTVALYFDTTKGCTAVTTDATGNYDTTLHGTVTYDGSNSPPVGAKSASGFSSANFLSNTGSALNDKMFQTPNSWTIQAYVRVTTAAINCLFYHKSSGVGPFQFWGFNASRLLYTDFDNTPIAGVTALTNGTWYHIAYTYDGTTVRYYLNGKLDKSQAASRAWANQNDWRIGLSYIGGDLYPFQGQINQLRIMNTVETIFPTRDPDFSTLSPFIKQGTTNFVSPRWNR